MTETGGGVVIAATTEPRQLGVACIGKPDAEAAHRPRGRQRRALRRAGRTAGAPRGPDPRAGFFRDYLKDPEATEEAWAGGWFHTGDVVRRAADGSFHFVDRRKNVIRRSGENIAAVEVESVLQQHPGVQAVARCAATPDAGARRRGVRLHRGAKVRGGRHAGAGARDRRTCACRASPITRRRAGSPSSTAMPVTATQKIQRGAMKQPPVGNAWIRIPRAIDTRALKKRNA